MLSAKSIVTIAVAASLAAATSPRVETGQAGSAVAILTADPSNTPFWRGIDSVAALAAVSERHLAHARALLDVLTGVRERRTVQNTLRVYDDIFIEASAAQAGANVIQRLHADESYRRAAEPIVANVDAFTAALSLNRAVYDALRAVDVSRESAEVRHYLARELEGFQLAGVDRDEATRAQLQDLRRQLTQLLREFNRNVADGTRSVSAGPAALSGLPDDFVARHPRAADGSVTFTTQEPDARPVLTYARDAGLRRRMYVALNNVAYPANIDVLRRMLQTRAEIAQLLGFPNWAEYDLRPRMAGTVAAATAFIDQVVAASAPKSEREFAQLLARRRQDQPASSEISAADNFYETEQVRRASYSFDSQQLRPYFPFDRVLQGLLDVTSRLYGVEYRRVADPAVWHPSVEVYEVLQGGRLLGRVYLDLHPRPRKEANGATTTVIRRGVGGRQIAEVALIAALPGGQPPDPGLMTIEEVTTFFHEFGHVLQHVFSGQRPWFGTSGNASERDFVEAPSQLFEEWTHDPATLALFARHYRTGTPIPRDLILQMRHASEFGQALNARSQMVFARVSLSLHDRDPQRLDLETFFTGTQRALLPFTPVDNVHPDMRFTLLANTNYSASYYTYMWSQVIAKDLLTRFDPDNLMTPAPARAYRDGVLMLGSSKPAAELVSGFLGRPFRFDAWQRWINTETPPPARSRPTP